MDNTPDANASNAAWTSYFASAGHRGTALASGFLGVAATLAPLAFLVIIWTRVARPNSQPRVGKPSQA